MPDKPLTVITYAASASLAAAALVYFFNPNYLIDGESATSSANMRRKGVVGLSNPANDCFINSILQALAGLRELRLYLIRELHRRSFDAGSLYTILPEKGKDGKPINSRKMLSLQKGEVTQGLKDILDNLNERPIQKKTISASGFVAVLERSFGTRISKAQQDAQELLQVVAERVSDEYHAGRAARARARQAASEGLASTSESSEENPPRSDSTTEGQGRDHGDAFDSVWGGTSQRPALEEEELGFPLEGRTESQVECLHCRFIPKSTPISFVMLTLPVPQKNHTTLSECFDFHFKTEHIDDYKCDRCRLQHAVDTFRKDLSRARTEKEHRAIQHKIELVEAAIAQDPERPPPGVELPSIKLAPARRSAKHVRIVDFPQILVVHLSRSIFDSHSSSKNTARVAFPEQLPLGGLVHRRHYRLMGVVSHKGTHHSGHYETFRRQHIPPPTPTPHTDPEAGPYSRSQTPPPPTARSPTLRSNSAASSSATTATTTTTVTAATAAATAATIPSPLSRSSISISSSSNGAATDHSSKRSPLSDSAGPSPSPPSLSAMSSSHALGAGLAAKPAPPYLTTTPAASHTSSMSTAATVSGAAPGSRPTTPARPVSRDAGPRASAVSLGPTSPPADERRRASSVTPRARSLVAESAGRLRRGAAAKKSEDRWWRISDDKIKECRTHDVLSMQKEVYILFYEIEPER